MSVRLSDRIDDTMIRELRRKLGEGIFPGISFEDAMKFLLSDGMIPVSGQPVESYLALETWVRSARDVTFSATDLKNKTGLILETVARGQRVIIERHGRPIAEIRRLSH